MWTRPTPCRSLSPPRPVAGWPAPAPPASPPHPPRARGLGERLRLPHRIRGHNDDPGPHVVGKIDARSDVVDRGLAFCGTRMGKVSPGVRTRIHPADTRDGQTVLILQDGAWGPIVHGLG